MRRADEDAEAWAWQHLVLGCNAWARAVYPLPDNCATHALLLPPRQHDVTALYVRNGMLYRSTVSLPLQFGQVLCKFGQVLCSHGAWPPGREGFMLRARLTALARRRNRGRL